MCLQIGRINHDCLVLGAFGSQARHDPGEDPFVTPAFPSVVEDLGWAVFLARALSRTNGVHALAITPSRTSAIDKFYTAQDAPVIDPRLAMIPREERPRLCLECGRNSLAA